MDRIIYDFLSEYTKLLNDELDYSRSGYWLSRLGRLAYNLFHFLPTKQKEKKGGARLIEQEGDLKSLEYFKETINQLVQDNKDLKAP